MVGLQASLMRKMTNRMLSLKSTRKFRLNLKNGQKMISFLRNKTQQKEQMALKVCRSSKEQRSAHGRAIRTTMIHPNRSR